MNIPFANLDRAARARLLSTALWFALGLWFVELSYTAVTQNWGHDTPHFWVAARTLLDGGNPYVSLNRYPGAPVAFENGQFTHLPWTAILFIPLALLHPEDAIHVWAIVNMLLLLGSIYTAYELAHHILSDWAIALVALVMLWLGVRCVQTGHTGILVTTGILLGLKHWRQGDWLSSGCWFSLSLFKPWIALGAIAGVWLIALLQQRWKFIAGFVGGTIILLAISTTLWPGWISSYAQVDFTQTLGVKEGDQYIEYWMLATLFDFVTFVLQWHLGSNLTMLLWLLLGAAVTSLGIATFRHWRAKRMNDEMLIGIGTLLVMLVFPHIRFYDYVTLNIWLVGILIGGKRHGLDTRTLGAIGLLIGIAIFLILGEHPESWVYQILFWLYLASWVVIWRMHHPITASTANLR